MPRETRTNTLGDLAYTQRLYANCGAWGRSVPLDVRRLIDDYGRPMLAIGEILRRLRCARCGRRTGDLRIVYSTGSR